MRAFFAAAGMLLSACILPIADVEHVPSATLDDADAGADQIVAGDATDSADSGSSGKDAPGNDGPESAPETGGVDVANPGSISFVQVEFVECPLKTTCSLPLTKPVTAGNAMIVAVAVYATPTATVTDSLGDAYTFVVGPVDDPSYRSYVAAAYNTPPGANTVSVAASSRTDIYIWASEYKGVTAFDVQTSATGNSTTVATPYLTTTSNNELLFGYVGYFVGGTVDPSFTFRSTGGLAVIEDRLVSTAGNYQLTGTQFGTGNWTMNLAAFKGR
jgi:hypothetical protein